MAYVQLKLDSSKPLRLDSTRGDDALRRVINKLMASLTGADRASGFSILSEESSASLSHSAAVCKMATSSGTVGVVVNGTSVTVTWATSDTNSQALLVAAVNANSTARALGVRASRYVGVLSLSSLASASVINVCGRRFVAGTDFSVAGSDNADAAAFAVAINATPGLNEKVVAVPDASAGVMYLCLMEDRAARSDEVVLLESGSGLTITSQIAAAAYSVVFSRTPGAIANGCTLTASGTNVTAHSAVSGKLGGGVGGVFSSTATYVTSDMR